MSSPYKAGGKAADHKEIDANLGTMDDFKELVAALHDNDIKMNTVKVEKKVGKMFIVE